MKDCAPDPWLQRWVQAAAVCAMGLGGEVAAQTVRLCVPDVDLPPYAYRSGQGAGLMERLLLDAGRAAGLQVQIRRLPSVRCRLALLRGEVDAMPLPPIPAYLDELDFPLQQGRIDSAARLLRLQFVLLRRRGAAMDWDGQRLSPATAVVGIRLGVTTLAERLQGLGAQLDDKAFSNEQLLAKLLAGRIDLAAMSLPEFEALRAAQPRAAELEVLAQPLLATELHLAFSRRLRHVPAEQLQAWREQLKRLRDSPPYQP